MVFKNTWPTIYPTKKEHARKQFKSKVPKAHGKKGNKTKLCNPKGLKLEGRMISKRVNSALWIEI